MKFNMMIGGVETLFPEAEVYYYEKKNEVVIFFLKINKEDLRRTEQNMRHAQIRIEENHLILKLKDFQYAYNLNQNENLIDLYMNGTGLGFAFKDENDKLLNVSTPTVYHEV